jgi:hypothetical protein
MVISFEVPFEYVGGLEKVVEAFLEGILLEVLQSLPEFVLGFAGDP